jgi:hypothetical protein
LEIQHRLHLKHAGTVQARLSGNQWGFIAETGSGRTVCVSVYNYFYSQKARRQHSRRRHKAQVAFFFRNSSARKSSEHPENVTFGNIEMRWNAPLST